MQSHKTPLETLKLEAIWKPTLQEFFIWCPPWEHLLEIGGRLEEEGC